jgi:hypothetical protein
VSAIDFVRLAEFLHESEGQPAARGFVVLSQAKGDFCLDFGDRHAIVES